MFDDLGEGKVWRINIKVTLDHLQVWGYITEEVIGFAIGQVSQAKGLADLARSQEFAELSSIRVIK